jgi:GNAT superfamily N-acetyltransferase
MQDVRQGSTGSIAWAPPRGLALRLANGSEARAIASLWQQVQQLQGKRTHLNFADVLDAVRDRMSQSDSHFLLAFDGELPVGMVHIAVVTQGIGPKRVRFRRMHLSMLAIDPTYWRGGVRRDLLAWCLAYAHANRIDTVALWTHAEHNQKLFERLGFRFDHSWKLDLEGDLCARFRYEVDR